MSKETYMIESLTKELVVRLMEEKNLPMLDAMDLVYKSKTFKVLSDIESGLYFQSSVYLYDALEEEFRHISH